MGSGSGFGGRRSMTSTPSERKGVAVVGTVKGIEKAPNSSEKKVKIKLDEDSSQSSIYVPKKFASELKPERKYTFHLEESTFRGGSQSRLADASMIRRATGKPEECKDGGFSSGSGGKDARW